ncbi:NAD-dependent epimerase/dehydratase family protein [Sphingomonas sp.]|uniref:NAD-dependent epimerase/dehydratase family protein n=1 Tax=Sphingomonas sp. TaxID=28214 RepID=UPI0035C87269
MASSWPPTAIIGGNSSIARHLLRLLPGARCIARRGAHEGTISVGRYADVEASHLAGAEVVINCAGIVSGEADALRAVNVELQRRLAEIAHQAGARRYIAISSFSVFGPRTWIDEHSPEDPHDDYGASKRDGDKALRRLNAYGFETVSVAFPAIIGTTRPGKVERMLRWWRRFRFLPTPHPDIRRSMVGAEAAAQVLVGVARSERSGRILAADPVPFSFQNAASWLREDAGFELYRLPVPQIATEVLRKAAPRFHASMMSDSLLDPQSNVAVSQGWRSTLRRELVGSVVSGVSK